MLSVDTHAHPKVSSHRRRSYRTNTKRPHIVTTSFSPLPCKRPKSTTDDPYSTENLLATLENLKVESAERIKRAQQLKCVELTAALVDFFADKVISPLLRRRVGNWYYNVRNQLQLDNVNRQRSTLVEQVETIAISKGLKKEQWQSLIFLALSTGESACINIVTPQYLNEVRKLSTQLEPNDHQTVCVLIDAIEDYLKKMN